MSTQFNRLDKGSLVLVTGELFLTTLKLELTEIKEEQALSDRKSCGNLVSGTSAERTDPSLASSSRRASGLGSLLDL